MTAASAHSPAEGREVRRPLRIMMVCSWSEWGGTEAYVCRHAAALRRQGHHVVLACRPGSQILRAASDSGVPCLPLLSRTAVHPAPLLRLCAALLAGRFDLLHAHRPRDSRLVSAASRITRVPYIFTWHSTSSLDRRTRARMAAARKIIAVSQMVRRTLLEVDDLPAELVTTIYPGIEWNALPARNEQRPLLTSFGIPLGATVVGAVNQLIENKNTDVLIRAAAMVTRTHPEVRFVIVGKGAEQAALQQLAQDLGASERVIFTGFLSDANAARREFDIFVAPGQFESFGYSILEAMACGLPVIAPRTDAPAELVVEGFTGLLAPCNDTAAMALAIASLVDNPEAARRMGQAGYERASEFTYEKELQRLEGLYYTAVHEGARPFPTKAAAQGSDVL